MPIRRNTSPMHLADSYASSLMRRSLKRFPWLNLVVVWIDDHVSLKQPLFQIHFSSLLAQLHSNTDPTSSTFTMHFVMFDRN